MEVDHHLMIHYTAPGWLIIGYIGSKVAARFPTGFPPSYFDLGDRGRHGQQRHRPRFIYKETRLLAFSNVKVATPSLLRNVDAIQRGSNEARRAPDV